MTNLIYGDRIHPIRRALIDESATRFSAGDPSGGFFGVLSAAFEQENFAVNAANSLLRNRERPEPVSGYNPFSDDDLTGYEDIYSAFVNSESPLETLLIKGRVDRERKNRAILSSAGWGGFTAQIAAGFLSPENLIPVASAYRIGRTGNIVVNALKIGAATATGAALSEGLLQQTQYTRTTGESISAVGSAFVLGTLFGGSLSSLGSARFKALEKLDEITLGKDYKDIQALSNKLDRQLTGVGAAESNVLDRALETYIEKHGLDAQYDPKLFIAEVVDAGGGDAIRDLPAAGRLVLKLSSSPFARMSLSRNPAVRKIAQRVFKTPIAFKEGTEGISRVALESQVQTWIMRGHFTRAQIKSIWLDGLKSGETKIKDYGEWKEALRVALSYPSQAVDPSIVKAEAKYRVVLDEIEGLLKKTGWIPEDTDVKFADAYFTRVFDLEGVQANRQAFIQEIQESFLQGKRGPTDGEGPVRLDNRDVASARRLAEDTVSRIEKDSTGGLLLPSASQGTSAVATRSLPISDARLLELGVLKTDPEEVLDSLIAHQVSRAIVSDAFGSLTTRGFRELPDKLRAVKGRLGQASVEHEISDIAEDADIIAMELTYSVPGRRSAQETSEKIDLIRSDLESDRVALREARLRGDAEKVAELEAQVKGARSTLEGYRREIFEDGSTDLQNTAKYFGLSDSRKLSQGKFEGAGSVRARELESRIADLEGQLEKFPEQKGHKQSLTARVNRLRNEIEIKTKQVPLRLDELGQQIDEVTASIARKRQAGATNKDLKELFDRRAQLIDERKTVRKDASKLRGLKDLQKDLKSSEKALRQADVIAKKRKAINSALRKAEKDASELDVAPTKEEIAEHFQNTSGKVHSLRRANAEVGSQMRFVENYAVRQFDILAEEAKAKGDLKEARKIEKEKDNFQKDLDVVRHRLYRENKYSQDPAHSALRAGALIRDLNFLRLGGGFALSSLPDIGMHIFRQGLGTSFKTFTAALTRDISLKNEGGHKLARLFYMSETVGNHRAANMADLLDQGGVTRFEKIVRGARDGVQLPNSRFRIPGFATLTGLSHWNAYGKAFASFSAAHNALSLARRLYRGLHVSPKKLAKAAELGLDENTLRKIGAEWDALTVSGKRKGSLMLAHTDEWADQGLARRFEAAVVSDVNNTIVDIGVGELPRLADMPVLGLFLQFRRFGLSAQQVVLASGLSHRDGNVLMGMMAMIFWGGVTEVIKASEKGREIDDDTLWWNAIDRSGVLGFLTDYHNIAEKMSGYGIPRLMGGEQTSRYRSRGITDTLFGPSLGFIEDVGRFSNETLQGEFDQGTLDLGVRLAPYHNLVWARWALSRVANGLKENLPERAGP